MAGYSYDDFIKAVGEFGLGSEFSQEDMDMAKRYTEFGMSILNLKKDYQDEAMSYGYTENGKFRHSYGGLPQLPVGRLLQIPDQSEPGHGAMDHHRGCG